MPQFDITAPDGKTWTVTAPDGATQDQVLAYAKQHYATKKEPAIQIEDPGVMQTLAISAGRTTDRLIKGAQQVYYGATGNEKAQAELKQSAAEDDRLYKPLQEMHPFATAFGESAPAMLVGPGMGATTLLGNAGRMAASAAIPELLQYGSVQDRLMRGTGAAIGGAAVPVLGAVAKTGKALIEPLYNSGREQIAGRLLNRVAGDAAGAVQQRLASASPLVPGSMPTAAQVAESGGIAALERAAGAMNPEAYSKRAMDQASARMTALRGIAGDDAAMAAAKAARKTASESLYDAADLGVAPIDGMFRGLQMRPQFNAAIAKAQELAKNSGIDDIFFRDAKGKPVALLGQGAHFIKKALDEAGEFGSNTYTGKTGASAAGETNKIFQTWLEKSVPEYAAGKAAFAEKSVPINQMEIGRALMDKAAPALSDYGALGRETAATFGTAMRNGDALAAKATGFSGATMGNVLSPAQMQSIEGVAKDLARKANAQDLGRGAGSDTFQKLSMSNIATQSGMPSTVGGLLSLPGISRATAWAYRDTDQKMQSMLADALLDPSKAAALMGNADKRWLKDNPKTRQLLEQAAMRGGGLLGLSAAPSLLQ